MTEIVYYQSQLSDRTVVRGDLDDWGEYYFYNIKTRKWDKSKNAFYSDDIEMSLSPSYLLITEEQAQEIINEHIRKGD